jgi:hypothetical protein
MPSRAISVRMVTGTIKYYIEINFKFNFIIFIYHINNMKELKALGSNIKRFKFIISSKEKDIKKNVLFISSILWIGLWLSINTGPWLIYNWESGLRGTIDTIRSYFPLIIFLIVFSTFFLKSFKNRSFVENSFFVYGFISFLACSFAEIWPWFDQAYWGIAFLATLGVIDYALRRIDPLSALNVLNKISWIMTSMALVVMLIVAREVLFSAESSRSAYGLITRFEATNGYVISRETGLSRMAVVPAIFSFVAICHRKSWRGLWWTIPFISSMSVIWIMQSRGALFAFMGAGIFLLLFAGPKSTHLRVVVSIILLIFVWLILSNSAMDNIWLHATREDGSAGFFTQSGRNEIWRELFVQFLASPIFGYGPQADRLFGWNAQNAYLYAFLSSGFIGGTFFCLALIYSLASSVKLLKYKYLLRDEEVFMSQCCVALLIFYTLRNIPENNAALFSVDLLIQYPAMLYCVYLWMSVKRRRQKSSRQN